MDAFLRGPQALDDGFGKTFVWLKDDDSEIIGFYNISTGSVDEYSDGNRYKIGGAIHINEFALDQSFRNTPIIDGHNYKLSDLLFEDCLNRVKYLRFCWIGFSFVTLQSTVEGRSLYIRHAFSDIEDDMSISEIQDSEEKCTPMYLALDVE